MALTWWSLCFVSVLMSVSQIVSPVSDKRVGSCYMDVPLYESGRLGVCNDEIASSVSRATCCCTVGLGWGEVPGFCEPCPKNGTGRKHFLTQFASDTNFSDTRMFGQY